MKTRSVFLITMLLPTCLGGLSPAASGLQDPRFRSAFWVRNYAQVDSDSALAVRAMRIFEQVRRVAGQGEQRMPRLLMIESNLDPLAMVLEDRTVVLSKTALDLAFQGSDPELGDSRLAFILGHELAHLSQQEFQHSLAFFSLSASRDSASAEDLSRILLPDRADLQRSELLADRQGLILMTVAGFDPALILREGSQFFERWVTQATNSRAYASADHPSASQRSAFLMSQLEPLVENLALFQLGTRSYQLRRFEQAAAFLEEFRLTFAGPAVLNNLGLSYYQLGLRKLAHCDGREVVRLRFPTLIDPRTVAERFRLRGPEDSCIEQIPEFEQALRELRACFQRAPDYHPGLQNLASLLILTGRSAEALVDPISRLLASYPGPESSLEQLLALYDYDRQNRRQDDTPRILAQFEQLAHRYPDSALIAYNRAMVVRQVAGHEAALPLLYRFLELETVGPFAEHVRELLDLAPSPPRLNRPEPRVQPLAPLGPATPAVAGWLRSSFRPALELSVEGQTYRLFQDRQSRVLQTLDQGSESIEWVEQAVGPLSRQDVIRRHGPPLWVAPAPSGEFLLYEKFAYDLPLAGSALLIFFR